MATDEDVHFVVHVKVEKVTRKYGPAPAGCRCQGPCKHKEESKRDVREVLNFTTSQPSLIRALDMGSAMMKLSSDVESTKSKETD